MLFQRGVNLRQRVSGLLKGVGIEVCRYASVVERIQELMSQGMSSGQAIALVAEELRASHTGERIVARFEDEDE